ncbi:MAG: cytochrome c biogenesis CcdA family protein [Salipiger thiooxidans]|uniref:Cytochrome c-type biogenesis protein n=1 Tax=Salipiger thiooxidans TaxID=282683 RepID=A0A1G7KDW6_9RHOB|nr:cytochrome c biogenesis protein CcdA [Salipiger thiooxidans]EEX13667.1 ShxV protein [Citreicella sp. SE45]MBR9839036.1 cytochrome C biogenesis protein CcdA [Paracoccaceae bacterium]NIY96550.1 cytochrome C biogenesis protein CcdA [Salipiger sp. HF18]MBN8189066.1 cytochrome C biogenesis protein CcdA [Salipiger thiooxidans]MCA0849173.1 cytochrome c biogenesis protein CcdA [Salipiger thiooxidans]
MLEMSFAGAALAGLLSFFTPCVLPMVPFYLCYMAGLSMTELRGDQDLAAGAQRRLVLSALFFAAGVTTIFVLLGMGATAVGQAFADWKQPLSYAAAALLLVFGLHFLGVIRVPLLYREARLESKAEPTTVLGAYLMGLAFGFGWTPCVGPALASILMIASGMGDIGRGGLLLLVYGIGMTAPFVVAAVFSGPFLRWTARHRSKLQYVEKLMGAMLIVFAILIATDSVNIIAQWMIDTFPGWTSLS